MSESLVAILTGADAPDAYQKSRIEAFLTKRYGEAVTLKWVKDDSLTNGFRITLGADTYDWSLEGRLNQLKDTLRELCGNEGEIIPLMRKAIEDFSPKVKLTEYGIVRTIYDGIAIVDELEHAFYGEILIFEDGTRGMVLDVKRDCIGCILFSNSHSLSQGSKVIPTGKLAGMPVGKDFIGRVVDALGNPIDGKAPIKQEGYLKLEAKAAAITERQPVNKPLETGILTIDSMFPIGKGQRELIIGDRQTGKTAIAIDTILNQKGKDVICIYAAIGQKTSSVAQLTENLRKHGALDYTIIIAACAGESTPLQYIAPYAACAMGEFFMRQGKDVLIVYDDLSKHAIAYRELSLLLGRSPGREAYPGDVFYLHSRLLERSALLSQELGGGSMTALPIVETQAGDVSAYIPTNIISITDGQIFLESELFFAGQRPAVNVGLSVSRVGGAAQTKAMKKASGAIRLDLAQYREMEVFTQFSSDLDPGTKRQLRHGQALMELLKQNRFSPMSQHEMVITLIASQNNAFDSIPKKSIHKAQKELLAFVQEQEPDICLNIDTHGTLSQEDFDRIAELAKSFADKKSEDYQ